MKTWASLTGGAVLSLAAFALLVSSASAASTYNFTIRGDVKAVDKTTKTVSIYSRHASEAAKNDLAGSKIEFNASSAKVYKYDKNGKKVRITLGNIPVGSEVVAKGAKRGEDRYNVSEITVNGNEFSLVGILKEQKTDNKTLKVEVLSSTYKEAQFKGKDIIISYGGNTKFRNQDLQDINSDELADNEERVKITGTVSNSSKFEALSVIDGYEKLK